MTMCHLLKGSPTCPNDVRWLALLYGVARSRKAKLRPALPGKQAELIVD
jgi:hypothetical protein